MKAFFKRYSTASALVVNVAFFNVDFQVKDTNFKYLNINRK